LRKIGSGIMLATLIVSLITLSLTIRFAKTEPVTIVVPDDYPTIQEAINHANENDTIFVRSGTYYENVVVNKTVLLIGESRDTTVVDGNGVATVFDVEALNVSISGFTVQNGEMGIWPLSYTKIHNNRIINNFMGIAWSMPTGYAIANVTISDNMISDNVYSGIYFGGYNSHHIIQGNTISQSEYGIYIYPHWEHVITGNTIDSNDYGIYIGSQFETGNSSIYHNNFINNIHQAYLDGSDNYKWQDDYPSGGNYWSDYSGVDEYMGPNQDQLGSDGIGDIPYVIDAKNIDRYPLMSPKMDNNDLFVVNVEPIQVVLDAKALIMNKKTVLRVDIQSTFSSDIIVPYIDVYYDFGNHYQEKGKNQAGILVKPGVNRIYIPGGPIYEKQGDNWIVREAAWTPPQGNDFFLKWTATGTDNNIKVKIPALPGEANLNNNERAIGKKVAEATSLKLLFIPVRFQNDPPSVFNRHDIETRVRQWVDFIEAVFPIPKLTYAIHWPSIDTPAPPASPSPFTSWQFWLYWNVEWPWARLAQIWGYDRAVVLVHDLDRFYPDPGITLGDAFGMNLLLEDRNFVIVDFDDFTAEWAVAHEIGHTYYLWHPWDREPSTYDAQRFWVTKREYENNLLTFMTYGSRTAGQVDQTQDLWIDKQRYDSYPKNRSGWFDKYSWNLFDQFKTGIDPEIVLLKGVLFRNGTGRIEGSWYRLLGVPDVYPESSGNFSIIFLDANRHALGEFRFNASFVYVSFEEGNTTVRETDITPFCFKVPLLEGTRFIEIRNSTNSTLIERIVTDNDPSVGITFPNGGEVLIANNYTISWNASDIDGDDLRYTVAYSADGGENWVPLAFDLNQTSYTWDTTYLESGTDYLVKVIATDSVNTGEDLSDGTFTVDPISPTIYVFSPLNKTYYSDSVPLTFEVNEALSLSWISYSLDNQPNVTLTGNTIINVSDSSHKIVLYANDTSGNMASSATVYFTVDSSLYDPWKTSFIGLGNFPIVDFAVYNGSLYAVADNNLYMYDGSSWNVIEAPTYILSLEPYEDKLIIGGQGGLYSYNGSTFNLIYSISGYMKPLGVYNNTLYAGTILDNPPTLYYCNDSAENPANWYIDAGFSSVLAYSGSFGSIDSFAVYNNTMYVTSGNTVYSFNGTGWNLIKTFDNVYAFLDMEVYNNKLYLATRDQPSRKPIYQGYSGFSGRVIVFDGNNWTTVFDHDYWIYSLETYHGRLYAGTANRIFEYNMTNWNLSFNSNDLAQYAISFEIYNDTLHAGMGNGYIYEYYDPYSLVTVHVEDQYDNPLSEIPVFIRDANTLEPVTEIEITNNKGNYFAVLPNGTYIAHAQDPLNPGYWHSQAFDIPTDFIVTIIIDSSSQSSILLPEFPSLIILPLFMIATLLAAIFYRKHRIKV